MPQSIAYAWSHDGADVAGATGSTLTASATGSYRCSTTATNAAGSATQTSAEFAVATPPPPAAKKPALSALRATRKKGATVFSFRLDQAATVTIVIRKATGGKPKVATLRRNVKAGLNKVTFRRKKAGRYRATFTPARPPPVRARRSP